MANSAESNGREWWDETWALAVVFGIASVPWTYAFVAGDVPLWPSFVASAAVFAAGSEGVSSMARGTRALTRALAAMLAGVAYAVATLAIVDAVGGGPAVLALVVGVFMLLASLHAAVESLSFTPGGFLGYASLFGVDAAGATMFGLDGLAGVAAATVLAVVVGAHVGWGVGRASERLA